MQMLALLIPLLTAVWVFIDAKDRGRTEGQAFLWALGTFLMLIIFLPIWLYVRWRDAQVKKISRCRYCNHSIQSLPDAAYCPYCGHKIERSEDIQPTIDIQ